MKYTYFLITINNEKYLEGERIDFPLRALGGETLYDNANATLVVYRINKQDGTVHEI